MSDSNSKSNPVGIHGAWSSRLTFILAATGSAVGLGNIWKFPYIAGENGGGAFVLVYLLCILVAGVPVMVAEVLMGRRGRSSPVHSVAKLADEAGANPAWHWLGWLGVVAGFIILSFYSVVAGWSLAYLPRMVGGEFASVTGAETEAIFSQLLANPYELLGWHTLFMVMTMVVVIRGVKNGLGKAVEILMPMLFLLLVVVLFFGVSEGDFFAGLQYLFVFDFSALTLEGVLVALGHAFFTLSLGMGAIMAYGAYMPAHTPVGKTVLVVAFLDTLVALMAGLAIFSIVFASPDIDPGSGPGLLFVSLPIAFGNMSGGLIVGTLFFVLITFAAWSSAISLIEPAVAWFVETGRATRLKAGLIFGLICWLLGIGSVLSFNLWADAKLFGKFTWFDFSDFLTANIMLPLGGVFIAIFVGWKMHESIVIGELDMDQGTLYSVWRFLLRWLSPLVILVIFGFGIKNVFG